MRRQVGRKRWQAIPRQAAHQFSQTISPPFLASVVGNQPASQGKVPFSENKLAGRPSGAGLKARSRLQHSKSGGAAGVGRDDLTVWPSWRREPASTDARHLVDRQPFCCGRLGDASGRAEAAAMEGPHERLQRRDAAGGGGGKELE